MKSICLLVGIICWHTIILAQGGFGSTGGGYGSAKPFRKFDESIKQFDSLFIRTQIDSAFKSYTLIPQLGNFWNLDSLDTKNLKFDELIKMRNFLYDSSTIMASVDSSKDKRGASMPGGLDRDKFLVMQSNQKSLADRYLMQIKRYIMDHNCTTPTLEECEKYEKRYLVNDYERIAFIRKSFYDYLKANCRIR